MCVEAAGLLQYHHAAPSPAEASMTRRNLTFEQNYNFSSVAEAGTLQLEFKYLSHLTGDYVYWDKVEKVMQVIHEHPKTGGLVPLFLK